MPHQKTIEAAGGTHRRLHQKAHIAAARRGITGHTKKVKRRRGVKAASCTKKSTQRLQRRGIPGRNKKFKRRREVKAAGCTKNFTAKLPQRSRKREGGAWIPERLSSGESRENDGGDRGKANETREVDDLGREPNNPQRPRQRAKET